MKTAMRILFGILFSVAGVLHFKDEEHFRSIVPEYLPFRKAAVLITGVFEIVFGLLLLIKQPTTCLKKTIIAFLWVVFPANIYMARKELPLAGKQLPKWALYSRLPIQFVMIKAISKL
ncbi:MAG TPA: MauE/DoxX family redox-associated membrane protein [Staphylococcus sp.]|nr:MauE/DoxX family redox-associated membrane protein [Staphylococcus sp.]